MSATTKQGKVIPAVLKQYQGLVEGQQVAIRGFIVKNCAQPSRDLQATLEEGKKSGAISAIRPAYALYFSFAGEVLQGSKWAQEVEVSEYMKVIAVCQRSAGAEGAREIAKRATSWAQFVALTRKAEEVKASKRNGGKRKSSKKSPKAQNVEVEVMAGELVIPDTISGVVTVGMSLRMLAKRIDSAEDISLSADEIELAEKVAKKLVAIAKVAKSANHPSVKAQA